MSQRSTSASKGDKAIKIHIGVEPTVAFDRPVAAIVEVKACGGKPFVTDTTTLTYHAFNNATTARRSWKAPTGTAYPMDWVAP